MKLRKETQNKIVESENDQDKIHLHTTLRPENYALLKQLSLNYGNLSHTVEEALKSLAIQNNVTISSKRTDLNTEQLRNQMNADFRMVAVGRRTFLAYIESLPISPMKNNNAIELIEWYYGASIIQLTLNQILHGFKAIWIAGNYFRDVSIEPLNAQNPDQATEYKMVFFHDFNLIQYGEYWAKYFQCVLSSIPQNCRVDAEIRNETFYLIITQQKK